MLPGREKGIKLEIQNVLCIMPDDDVYKVVITGDVDMHIHQYGTLTFGNWNVGGWTQRNCHLRQEILDHYKTYIICLTGTHLKDKDNY